MTVAVTVVTKTATKIQTSRGDFGVIVSMMLCGKLGWCCLLRFWIGNESPVPFLYLFLITQATTHNFFRNSSMLIENF